MRAAFAVGRGTGAPRRGTSAARRAPMVRRDCGKGREGGVVGLRAGICPDLKPLPEPRAETGARLGAHWPGVGAARGAGGSRRRAVDATRLRVTCPQPSPQPNPGAAPTGLWTGPEPGRRSGSRGRVASPAAAYLPGAGAAARSERQVVLELGAALGVRDDHGVRRTQPRLAGHGAPTRVWTGARGAGRGGRRAPLEPGVSLEVPEPSEDPGSGNGRG